jgi:CheY-like chemotaxis protein
MPWHKHDVTADIDQAFTVPDYRVLVVDDNKINLKVAVQALSPYGFQVDEAKSGAQAIDMVKETRYDLILMDHMMPEMDGIETTDHIRKECGENGTEPIIIALSANAYNNAREMFMSNGFQDFIAKPIEKSELHKLLLKWIPQERRQPVKGTKEAEAKIQRANKAELFMSGVDVGKVLASHTGGVDEYVELLELYYMDGAEKCAQIEELANNADYRNYEIEVHGLKSASANIGAFELSELAKEQEYAAKEGRYEQIQNGIGKLLAEYRFILHEIENVLKTRGRLKPEEETASGVPLTAGQTRERMREILEDIENFQSKPAAQKTEALLSENIEKSARDCLKDVRNRLKMYDDDSAEDLLRAYLGESTVTEET